MLTQIPERMRKNSRKVTLRHPNSVECTVHRKIIKAENQTLGGMVVLSSEDDSDVDWTELGEGKFLRADGFDPSSFNDAQTGYDYVNSGYSALIEPIEQDSEKEGFFIPKKHDIVYLHVSIGFAIAYQITDVINATNIPPFLPKYEVQKRDDLLYVEAFKP